MTKHKIELQDWHYQCGDKCCDDYGTSLIVNGVVLSDDTSLRADELKELFKALNIDVDIEETQEI